MTIAIYIFILLINAFCYFNHHNGIKNNKIVIAVSLILLGVIYSVGTNNLDMQYVDYMGDYSKNVKGYEWGYYVILYICRKLNYGLVFERALFYLIGSFFFALSVRRSCGTPHLFLVFYMVLFFPIDAIQMRFFVASSIVFFATTFMYGEQKKVHYFIFWILIASLFHTSVLLFLILLIGEVKEKKFWMRILASSVFLLEIIFILNGRRDPFLYSLIGRYIYGKNNRVFQYAASSTENGSFFVVLIILVSILLTWTSYRMLKRYDYKGSYMQQAKWIMYANIIQLFFVPMLWLNVEFYRFPRCILCISLASVINSLNYHRGKLTKKRLNFILIFILCISLWFYVMYFRISDFNSIFEPIFFENEL